MNINVTSNNNDNNNHNNKLKKYFLLETTTINKKQYDENIKDELFFDIEYCNYSTLFNTLLKEFEENVVHIDESIAKKYNKEVFDREFIALKRIKKKKDNDDSSSSSSNNDYLIIIEEKENNCINPKMTIKKNLSIPIDITTPVLEKFIIYFEYLHKKNNLYNKQNENKPKEENFEEYEELNSYFDNDNYDDDDDDEEINDEYYCDIIKDIDKFEKILMNVDLFMVFEMLRAADYIDCKQLITLCCKKINEIIRNCDSNELQKKLSFLNLKIV